MLIDPFMVTVFLSAVALFGVFDVWASGKNDDN